jgi:hypothetical protein
MFSYRPPKGSCWGHAIRGKDLQSATDHLHRFLATYFEPIQPDGDAYDFSCLLRWRESMLPNVDWPAELDAASRESLCMVTLGGGSRIGFPGGLLIPLSPAEPSSYEFLRRFAADAPFKMSAKHFSVGSPSGGKSIVRWGKADGEVLWRLQGVI